MKQSKCRCRMGALLVCLVLSVCGKLWAQDALPPLPAVPAVMAVCDTLPLYSARTDTVAVPPLTFPSAFLQTTDNYLTDSVGLLNPFWEKLRLLHAGASDDTICIVHIGDSHVRGHIFPQTTGTLLQQVFGALTYTDMGINGATCRSFTRPERVEAVAALHPDLLILSFGTNEAHNRRYLSSLHYRQMAQLVRLLQQALPHVPMLLTTPPGAYERVRRRVYRINPRTQVAVQTMRRFADDNGLALWNLYEIGGGARRACRNWWEAGLMRPDHIHFLPEGYDLQGRLLFHALLKAYNDYVESE